MNPTRRGRLFVHGVPNAGKTAWFAGLYGLRDRVAGDALLTFDHAPTNHDLRQRWRHFQEGIAPRATPPARPERLRWNLRRGGETWAVTAIDYSGTLVEAGRTPALVREHLSASDALLLLLDCAEPDVNQLDALAILLDELRQCDGPPRPVALLLTKADRLTYTGNASDLRDRALQRFRGHAGFRQIERLLKESGGEQPFPIEVFPVSLCGASTPAGSLPMTNFWQPLNLYEPLVWTIDAVRPMQARWHADELEAARTEARRRLGTGTAMLWPDFRGALRAYTNAERTARLSEGPHAEQAAADVRALQHSRWSWRKRALAVIAGGILLLLLGGWRLGGVAAGWAFDDLEQFCEAHPGEEFAAERLQRREALLASTWARDEGWWLTADRRQRVEDALENDRAASHRHAFAELVRRRDELVGEENALARIRLVVVSPLLHHPRYEDVLSRFLREDDDLASRHRERTMHEEIVAAAPAMRRHGQYQELHQLCDGFLDQFPGSPHAEQVRATRDEARQAWDAQTWERTRTAEVRNPTAHRDNRDRYRRYLEVPEAVHHKEASAAIARIEQVWDREEYERIRPAAGQPMTWQEVEESASLVRVYLDADREVKRGRETVRAYYTWTQRLRLRQGRYTVRIESLTVPPEVIPNEATRLQLELNAHGTKQTSEWFVPNQLPGRNPFESLPLMWRDDLVLSVILRESQGEVETRWEGRIAAGRAGESLPKAETVLDVELNAEKRKPAGWVPKATGIRLRLRITCPDAVSPALPPYPARDG